jgi:glutamyl/glutaminyl-tRNA synthetase
MSKKQIELEEIDLTEAIEETIEETIDFSSPYTPNLSYADWMNHNDLTTIEDCNKFLNKLSIITEEQKEHVKNELKLIIK